MWPKIKKLLVLGLGLGFLQKNVHYSIIVRETILLNYSKLPSCREHSLKKILRKNY